MDGLTRRVTVLGSTGSVGVSTLDVIRHAEQPPQVAALVANRNVAKLAEQALQWRPQLAVVADEALHEDLKARLAGSGIATAAGPAAVLEAANLDADWVMSAIVGSAGLAPTLAAAERGATIALANKESLVCAGPALLAAAKRAGGQVIPVDSEHSAIFQALGGLDASRAARLILTSSGGPFRGWTREAMAAVTPAQAITHPNFAMGAKISVDSAQMMNKGLEVIEAAYLFDMPSDRIEVLIHPQQIVHSLVEFVDGSSIAQLGPPDMRPPVACAFAWPDRMAWPAPKLDLAAIGQLTFEAPDVTRFPAISLARHALTAGGFAPAAMNAANEVAVAAFLDQRIGFLDIAATVSETLERMSSKGEIRHGDDALEGAMTTDASARRVAAEVLPHFERL